jgi:hypothetical protein
LREFAEKTFALDAPDDNGVSYRTVIEGLLARTRKAERCAEYEAELAVPPLPSELAYLWDTFWRLRRRKQNAFAASAIEWTDIDAFLRLTRTVLNEWEISVIEMLDDLYLGARAPKAGTES